MNHFRKKGSSLSASIAKGERIRAELVKQIDTGLVDRYEKIRVRCGGLALAELKSNSCGACRSQFDVGKLSIIFSEAPLSDCPICHRMLVVEEGK